MGVKDSNGSNDWKRVGAAKAANTATLYKVAALTGHVVHVSRSQYDTVLAGASWRYFWEKYSTDVGRNFEVVSHM